MGIGVECPGCQTSFRVAEQYAGKRGRCPNCQGVIQLPEASPTSPPAEVDEGNGSETYEIEGAKNASPSARMTARASVAVSKPIEPAPTSPTRTPVQILASFRGEIKRVRPSLMYRAWVLLIAMLMLLLPAIYLGLIALVGYGVYLHAITNHSLLQGKTRNSLQVALVVYVGPIIAGVVVIAFMFKPLFAGRAKQAKVRRIDPVQEPLIGAFVEGVCSSVGAPRPARIEVDCQVNASAGLASWALSPSRELVLKQA